MKSLLLMSSSRAANPNYLEHAFPWLADHFSEREVLFIPYAVVTMKHEAYTATVRTALAKIGIQVVGIEESSQPEQAIRNAKAIAVGGGNTFMLLHLLYKKGLIDILKQRIQQGIPYAGWSAGSNIVGPSIRTTNDMPIIQPASFTALNQVKFQINPHFTDATPAGHRGETRSQRITEFMHIEPSIPVLGIPEGAAVKLSGNSLKLIGNQPATLFQDLKSRELPANTDLSFLL